MDPELIQAAADASGLLVEHRDGHSIVHGPDGPMHIPHPPGARVPRRTVDLGPDPVVVRAGPRTVDLGPDPVTVHASPELAATIRQMDDARAQVAAYRAQHGAAQAIDARERTQREIADQSARELAAMERAQGYRVSDPDAYGITTRTYLDGRRSERLGPDTAFRAQEADLARAQREVDLARLRSTPTHAGVLVGPDGSRVVTDDAGTVVEATHPLGPADERAPVPADVPAEWLTGPDRMAADLRAGYRDIAGQAAEMHPPAPSMATAPAPAPVAPPTYGPTLEQLGATPDARRPGGGARAPMGVGGARMPAPVAPSVPLPQAASDAMISGLAQGSVGPRRAPDLIDRQMLHDQQVAQAGRDDAVRQLAAERTVEAQRQRDEADRRQAMAGATRAYQNAVDRVASARLDPSRWYRDQGAGGTIAAAIAIALGGLGQALGGTDRNLALEEINRSIDRDMEAQQSEIDSGRAAADLAGNMLSITRQEFGDRDAAREAGRAAMLRQVAAQTQAQAADLADDAARLNADALHEQLTAQAAEAEQAAVTRELEWRYQAARIARTEAEAAQAARRAMGGGGARPAPLITQTQRQAYDAALAQGLTPDQAAAESFPAGSYSAAHPPAHAALSGEERSSLEDLSVALDMVEREMPADRTQDIPGFGLTGMVPRLLLSQEGTDLRASVANLRDAFARDRTGANLPESELAAFNVILGTSDTSSDEDLRHGLSIMRAIIAGHLSRSASGTDVATRDIDGLGDGARWVDEGSP